MTQRYGIRHGQSLLYPPIDKDYNGEFVLYEDHLAEVAKLKEEIMILFHVIEQLKEDKKVLF